MTPARLLMTPGAASRISFSASMASVQKDILDNVRIDYRPPRQGLACPRLLATCNSMQDGGRQVKRHPPGRGSQRRWHQPHTNCLGVQGAHGESREDMLYTVPAVLLFFMMK